MFMKTAFGWIEIGNEMYKNDVILHSDGHVSKRRKKLSKELKAEYGHTPLSELELDFLEEENPVVVIIGTGQNGSLPVTAKAKKILDNYQSYYLRTPEAIEQISQERRPLVAILHVTC